ncbi:MAG: hypothetical protein Q8941_20585 [Bacteroidota bacterium]|nr:hypothetical protein [Bacteroidota bacterium]
MTDNMDDLMRKAAGDYPLKINDSDWERIAYRLATPVSPEPVSRKRVIGKYIGSFLIMLFLLLAGSFLKTFNPGGKAVFTGEKERAPYPKVKNNAIASIFTQANRRKTVNKPAKGKRYITIKAGAVDPGEANVLIIDRGSLGGRTVTTGIVYPQIYMGSNVHILPGNTASMVETINGEKKSNKPGARQVKRSYGTGFYYGVGLGPQLSEVKSQKMRKAGFDAGILLGYHFSPGISGETGILFSEKYYYSKGEHFKMDMQGMKLLSMEGNSSVFEIPARVKYDAWTFQHTKLFLTAGLSSYIIISEKNNYRVLMNGVEQNMNASYKYTTGYFAAAMNISAGFENKIGKLTGLRIEPYLQIPLKGIGVGVMPVMSTGIHFFITRRQ